jgi:hypothetical protein
VSPFPRSAKAASRRDDDGYPEREESDSASASTLAVVAVNRRMIRPILTELALFLTPFAIYAIYLWATRAELLHPESWPLPRLMWLTIAALALMAGSFIILAQWGGDPSGSNYIPAHMEDGKLVPGTTK